MTMTEIALKQIEICQAFLDSKMDVKTFKSSMMTLAFTAAGVSDDEMEAFNTALQALYAMKSIGRDEVLDVFKNVKGDTQEIVNILESEPIRQVPAVNEKAIPDLNKEVKRRGRNNKNA